MHEQALALFRRSLTFAREVGYLTGRKVTAALSQTTAWPRV
jgi:hypothetical protein